MGRHSPHEYSGWTDNIRPVFTTSGRYTLHEEFILCTKTRAKNCATINLREGSRTIIGEEWQATTNIWTPVQTFAILCFAKVATRQTPWNILLLYASWMTFLFFSSSDACRKKKQILRSCRKVYEIVIFNHTCYKSKRVFFFLIGVIKTHLDARVYSL